MINITCNCGTSNMTFNNLSADAFPKGWDSDCCETFNKKVEGVMEEHREALDELAPTDTHEFEAVEPEVEETAPQISMERKSKGKKK